MVAPAGTSPDQGRREHYGEFYGLRPLPDDGRPLLLVHGNCQAEAMRVLLAGVGEHRTVRVPPVHELEASVAEASRTRSIRFRRTRSGALGKCSLRRRAM